MGRNWYRQCLRSSAGLGSAAAVALLLLGTLAAGPAWADPTFFVDAAVSANGSFDTGPVQAVSVTAGPSILMGTIFNAEAQSTASLGELRALASASMNTDGFSGIDARAIGIWSDTFIATSSDPNVRQVTFLATMSLFDNIFPSGSVVGDALADLLLGGNPIILLDDAFGTPLVSRTGTFMFTEPVGVPFILQNSLDISVFAGVNSQQGSIVVDASDTAAFNLDPLTPDGGYTTTSGVSYLSSPAGAVPEPASLTLLGLGALGLLGYGRRRRHKPTSDENR